MGLGELHFRVGASPNQQASLLHLRQAQSLIERLFGLRLQLIVLGHSVLVDELDIPVGMHLSQIIVDCQLFLLVLNPRVVSPQLRQDGFLACVHWVIAGE